MRYMLLIYGVESALTDQERQDCYAESTALAHELASKGQFLGASPLQPTALATSVRLREGRRLVTDGPFAETHEHLGGFFMIDVENLDAALEVAGRIPMAKKGTVEVRPVIEIPNLPETA